MAKHKSYNYSQEVLIPVSLEEQLMPGTLEFAIHTLVETRAVYVALDNSPDTVTCCRITLSP